jgi:hypothetical protein
MTTIDKALGDLEIRGYKIARRQTQISGPTPRARGGRGGGRKSRGGAEAILPAPPLPTPRSGRNIKTPSRHW